jgi:5-methylthioadenosine/S-adenosylhomocysteine deaminase
MTKQEPYRELTLMKTNLLRGGYVITDPALLTGNGIIRNGGVLVRDGKVAAIGSFAELQKQNPDATIVGSEKHVVMPGLINAHHHGRGFMGLQLGIVDGYLEEWMLDYWLQRPLDIYLDTMYANIRMLRAGVTTVIHSGYSRDWSQTAAEARSALRAYDDSGMRVSYAAGVEDQNTFVLGDNETFIASLPDKMAARVREALYRLGASQGYDYFELVDELVATYADHPRIKVLYGPTGPEWCSPGLLRKIAERAKAAGMGIHLHALESPLQHDFSWREHGKSSVALLRETGILGPKTSLAHATWLSEEDISICADMGASACHNASSNLRLHNGIAPVARMLELGMNVGIGMDGWALNSDDDMLQEMRLVSYIHRVPRQMRPLPAPDANDILRMATLGGAKASVYGDAIGRLTVGANADAVLLDYAAMTYPYIDPRTPLAEAIVGLGRGRHVDTVMVGGEILVEGGRYLKRDEAALVAELATIADKVLPAHLQEFYGVIEDLKPYVKKFYDQWPPAAKVEPLYSVNSRI